MNSLFQMTLPDSWSHLGRGIISRERSKHKRIFLSTLLSSVKDKENGKREKRENDDRRSEEYEKSREQTCTESYQRKERTYERKRKGHDEEGRLEVSSIIRLFTGETACKCYSICLMESLPSFLPRPRARFPFRVDIPWLLSSSVAALLPFPSS